MHPANGDQYSNSAASAQFRHTVRAGRTGTVEEQDLPADPRAPGSRFGTCRTGSLGLLAAGSPGGNDRARRSSR